MIDRKGIFWFLTITFGLTWAIQIAAFSTGFTIMGMTSNVGTLVVLPFMFMPALGAFITARFITKEGFTGMGLRLGSWKEYLRIGLLFPALFILVYAITWLLGFGAPDWNLEYFKGLFTASNMPAPQMPDTRIVLAAVYLSSLTVGTIFNWVFCTGEEIGWRGYLLPKLMPLGKTHAYLLLGLIWSIWHWPLVWMGFTYYQPASLLALLAFTGLTTSLGVFLNELTLRTRSSLLAGWAHGVFNTQKLGMWFLLFPQVSPFLGGYAGLVGLLTWTALGFWEQLRKH